MFLAESLSFLLAGKFAILIHNIAPTISYKADIILLVPGYLELIIHKITWMDIFILDLFKENWKCQELSGITWQEDCLTFTA